MILKLDVDPKKKIGRIKICLYGINKRLSKNETNKELL